ncbi:MAG: LysR family transcriptional regulator [Nitratireductor sp.]|nr:LysR family transcriptional regulator [Nitratireductor sp.]
MYDLDLLRPSVAFATVVETGSFKRAAERMGLSAPYVSQMVSDLETRLGRQLLYRSTRRIALTDAGAKFLPHARTLGEAFRDGLAEVRNEHRGLAGSLRISAPTVLVSPEFARLVRRFTLQHPDLHLQIDFDDKAVDPVASRIDLAIRIGDPGNDARLARKLFMTRGLICCSAEEAKRIRDPGDLGKSLWIRSPIGPDSFEIASARDRKVHVGPDSQLVINNAAMIRSLLRAGSGFALFPEFAVREALESGAMANPLPDWAIADVAVHALYTEHRTALANARAFVEHMLEFVENRRQHHAALQT